MAGRIYLALAVCTLCVHACLARELNSMNTDRTLGTAGQTCKDRFTKIGTTLYASDADCQKLIQQAMSGTTQSTCPEGLTGSGPGSKVQQCMAKSKETQTAWLDFVKACEVFNVSNRGGEAEASTDAKPSCLPRFGSVQEFQNYLGTTQASSAASAGLGWGAVAAAVAVAAAL